MNQTKIAILGCGNIGSAIAEGLTKSKKIYNKNITLTRRNLKKLTNLKNNNYNITSDNIDAIKNSEIIIFAVEPKHLLKLLKTVKKAFNDSHIIISVVTGIEISEIHNIINSKIPVVRAMPNTAISIQESMTCLSSENITALKIAEDIFNEGDTGTGGSIVEAAIDDFSVLIFENSQSILGDLNDDSTVNVLDVVVLVNIVLANECTTNADLNSDNDFSSNILYFFL